MATSISDHWHLAGTKAQLSIFLFNMATLLNKYSYMCGQNIEVPQYSKYIIMWLNVI